MKVTIVRGQEDWEGIYFEDEMIAEAHSIDAFQVLEYLLNAGEPVTEFDCFTLNDEAEELLNARGCLPRTLQVVNEWQAL